MPIKRKYLTNKTRLEIARQYKFTCVHCGKKFDENKLVGAHGYLWVKGFGQLEFHIDHLQSLHDGGKDDRSNLVFSCAKCNLSKGKKTTYGKKSYA